MTTSSESESSADFRGTPSQAAYDILAERQRQMEKGYDMAHDAKQTAEDLVQRAAGYLAMKAQTPAERRVQLIKAAAVTLAAIQRLDIA